MGVRPGRLLPSVIVGGLLATGLAFGAGTASATPPLCKIGTVAYDMTQASKVKVESGVCKKSETTTTTRTPTPTTAPDAGGGLADAVNDAVDAVTEPIVDTVTTWVAATPADVEALNLVKYVPPVSQPSGNANNGGNSSSNSSGGSVASGPSATSNASQRPSGVPAPAPASPMLAAAPAANLLAPGVGAGGLGLGALKGAPLAPGLFGVGAYNPGLLLGAPAGSPLANLAGTDPASAVTTTSQVQAMAFDGLPGGVGTPATIGVLILAGLAGFAVRHRVLTRMRRRDAALAATEAPAA